MGFIFLVFRIENIVHPSEGCFSDVRGPFRTQNRRYENCSHFWEISSTFWGVEHFRFWGVDKYLQPMFPYRVKYTESESDIQNNNLFVQNTPTMPKYIRFFGFLGKFSRKSKIHIFQKIRFQNDQRFMAIFMARLWRA